MGRTYFTSLLLLLLIWSCQKDNFDNTLTTVIETPIDTIYTNDGELFYKYQGEEIVKNGVGYVCRYFDKISMSTYTNYFITDGEYLFDSSLIILNNDSYVISYDTESEFKLISLALIHEGSSVIAQSIESEPITIEITEETDSILVGHWSASFGILDADMTSSSTPIGQIDGNFLVPKISSCQ